MEQTISGYFTYSVFKSQTYMVSSFKTLDDEYYTVTGPFYNFLKGHKYNLVGEFVSHPKYGYQFNYYKIDEILPDEKDQIISFLSSETFKGIGVKSATKIFELYGNDVLNILKNKPEDIFNTDLSSRLQNSIYEGFVSLNDPKNEIMYELILGGFSSNDSLLIYDHFKDITKEIIDINPFKLYLDVHGISFEKVFEFCKKKDFENKNDKFKETYLIYLFKEISFQRGDIYLFLEDFSKKYIDFFYDDSLEEIISKAIEEKYLYKEDNRYYLYDEYYNELFIADYLNSFKGNLNLNDELIDDAIKYQSKSLSLTYDDSQIDAIKSFFKQDISIITGGPGSGKTTVVKSLVGIFNEFLPFNTIVVVAPTGRAAKRISEICNVESKTIHSLLRWNKETNEFSFNEENPILYDAIIIDEFSMVDNFLFSSLLKASKMVKKICIIGDDNQLPSIRQGNVLLDLINSNKFVVSRLSLNHRQKEGSEIIDLAHDIIDNNVDLSKFNKDIFLYENIDEKVLISLIEEDIVIDQDLDDLMVLAPMYKGHLGIDNLNSLLQEHFNPADKNKNEKIIGSNIFRVGDRILQLKNRPNDDIYNGDIGILSEIDNKEKVMLIDYQDNLVYYNNEDVKDISLAYALSVHKSQGSEYRTIYLILPNYSSSMLTKKLLYTAVTRAKNKLVIIGPQNEFIKGINRKSYIRKTTLLSYLK